MYVHGIQIIGGIFKNTWANVDQTLLDIPLDIFRSTLYANGIKIVGQILNPRLR